MIHLISGPRNISTALMYSFGNRQDTGIIDEPFYAYYLRRHPDLDHPMKDEILNSQAQDWTTVMDRLYRKAEGKRYFFIKNMAHHIADGNWSSFSEFSNILLIRSPEEVIKSYIRVRPDPTLEDIGIKTTYELFHYLNKDRQDNRNTNCIVINSRDLRSDPGKLLSALCRKLDMPWDDDMLSWAPGARDEDGVWAAYWYRNVHASTGFEKPVENTEVLVQRLLPLKEEADEYFNELNKYALKG